MGVVAAWLRTVASVGAAGVAIAACGGGETTSTTGTTGSGGSGGGVACQAGQLAGDDSLCHPIGVQGCAARFVDGDGLCRPSMERCPKGTIPKFDQGCVAVGVVGCAKEFVEADGLCHVRTAKCPASTMAIPEKGCVPIDGVDGCGSGTWGNIPDGANVVYVDPSYSGGSSVGSKTQPFTTLAAGLGAAPTSGVVALAAGAYHESADLDRSLEIRGRCPSMVRIDGQDPFGRTVWAKAGSIIVNGVTLGGDGVGVYATTTTLIEGVVIDGALHFGVSAGGVKLTILGSLIRNTRSNGSLGALAVYGFGGSSVTITDSSFVGNNNVAIDASDLGTSFNVADVFVESTQPTSVTFLNGEGIVVEHAATMELSSAALVANHLDAIDVSGGSVLHATSVVAEGSLPQGSDGYLGAGLELYGGSKATFTGAAFLANRAVGILVGDPGSELTLDATLVTGTLPLAAGAFGRGLEVQDGAHATLKDSAVVGNHDLGILALSGGTAVDLERVLVEGTLPDGDGTWGVGVGATDLATLTMTSSVVTRTHVGGAVIADASAHITSSLLSSILAGTIKLNSPKKTIPGVGDGILAMLGGGGPVIVGTRIEDCARAGVLFDGGTGSITASSSTKNRFGVVLEGGTTASADDRSNAFAGNSAGDDVDDLKLDVPDKPATLPQ